MKIFIGFFFALVASTIVFGQDHLSIDVTGLTEKIQVSSSLITENPHVFLIKRTDREPDVPLLIFPTIPPEAQSAEKLIKYTNLIVEHFNQDQIEKLPPLLVHEWEKHKDSLKYEFKYGEYMPSSCIIYGTEPRADNNIPICIWVTSGLKLDSRADLEKKEVLSNLFVTIINGEVIAAGGYFPLISEEYCCLLRKTSSDGLQYLTFSYKDWPEKGHEKPTPWIIWTKQGEIFRQESKKLQFDDYDTKSLLTGEPKLK